MNLIKQQDQISELYRRGEIEAAKEKFEDLLLYCEETDETDHPAYAEALLGLGSLNQNDLHDLPAAEECWQVLVAKVDGLDAALGLDPDYFDIYTAGLLLLSLVQKQQNKREEAEGNFRILRQIAVQVRGEQSEDVRSIDEHLASLKK